MGPDGDGWPFTETIRQNFVTNWDDGVPNGNQQTTEHSISFGIDVVVNAA